jgi:pimeloyl-ACP methyl ester carboxylesterase
MVTSLYDLSVPTFLQTVRAVGAVLDRAARHCAEIHADAVTDANRGGKMATYILIPGGWHGGWYFQSFAEALRSRGHRAYAVTLTGLGERRHLLGAHVNLDTHVQDVVQLLEVENLSEVILLGHSYAGMVVSGVLDCASSRIAAAVYCDAYVPKDGQSCFDLANDFYRRLFLDNAAKDGFSVLPPSHLDPRATPHPLVAAFDDLLDIALQFT